MGAMSMGGSAPDGSASPDPERDAATAALDKIIANNGSASDIVERLKATVTRPYDIRRTEYSDPRHSEPLTGAVLDANAAPVNLLSPDSEKMLVVPPTEEEIAKREGQAEEARIKRAVQAEAQNAAPATDADSTDFLPPPPPMPEMGQLPPNGLPPLPPTNIETTTSNFDDGDRHEKVIAPPAGNMGVGGTPASVTAALHGGVPSATSGLPPELTPVEQAVPASVPLPPEPQSTAATPQDPAQFRIPGQ
jgi:hypothetical protein